jgi:ion channel
MALRHDRAMNYLRAVVVVKRHPCAILLLAQLLALVLYPFFENTDIGRIGLGIVGIVVLGVTIRMVERTPFRTWVGVCIALPAIALLLLRMALDLPQLLAWSSALESLFYFYAAGSLIAYMLADRRATADELFAAAGTFTLLAWAFAYLFLLTQALQPGSFAAAHDPEAPRTWTELMFLSFALLSSTGIGDIVPIRAPARGLASIEMFVGVMYLATVVSRLIGLTLLEQKADVRR